MHCYTSSLIRRNNLLYFTRLLHVGFDNLSSLDEIFEVYSRLPIAARTSDRRLKSQYKLGSRLQCFLLLFCVRIFPPLDPFVIQGARHYLVRDSNVNSHKFSRKTATSHTASIVMPRIMEDMAKSL